MASPFYFQADFLARVKKRHLVDHLRPEEAFGKRRGRRAGHSLDQVAYFELPGGRRAGVNGSNFGPRQTVRCHDSYAHKRAGVIESL